MFPPSHVSAGGRKQSQREDLIRGPHGFVQRTAGVGGRESESGGRPPATRSGDWVVLIKVRDTANNSGRTRVGLYFWTFSDLVSFIAHGHFWHSTSVFLAIAAPSRRTHGLAERNFLLLVVKNLIRPLNSRARRKFRRLRCQRCTSRRFWRSFYEF